MTMTELLPPPPLLDNNSHNNSCNSLPLQEVMTPAGGRRLSSTTLKTTWSDPMLHWQQENELLKRQLHLLKQQKQWDQQVEEEQKAVKSLRKDMQSKLQQRKDYLHKKSLRKTILSIVLATVLVAVAMIVLSATAMPSPELAALPHRILGIKAPIIETNSKTRRRHFFR